MGVRGWMSRSQISTYKIAVWSMIVLFVILAVVAIVTIFALVFASKENESVPRPGNQDFSS